MLKSMTLTGYFASAFTKVFLGASCSLDLQNPIQTKMLFHVVDVTVGDQIETTPRFDQACWRDLPSSPPFRATVIHDGDGSTDFDGFD